MRPRRWPRNLPAAFHSLTGYLVNIWELVINIAKTTSGAMGKTPLKAKNTRVRPTMFYQAKPTFRHRHGRDCVVGIGFVASV
jgi:hypothetical protein